ncbi:hypothetical protein B0J11DRAFT_575280 [Dendryphion nanum]|uniref:Uncharacterized protein n=1 Tax=Dendryphion nanum TaxID=256645 RepID=A0A9P9J107_9PLEO|nr:hypothetical protein B0J11DRAFT_575280 [Dendryphion nanum]
MSGLEVVSAVAAVISAFHGGAELIAHIKKKHRRRSSKSQTRQEFEEKQLQDSLETGEAQVVQRYATDMKELGEVIRVGDAIARDRLLHIAVVMQAEIIKSLQLAVKYDNAILNLTILLEASILNRNNTIVTLDELKQRILITRPMPRTLRGAPDEQRDFRASLESVQSFRPASLDPIPDNYIPSAVTISTPGDSKDSRSGLARYFSTKRNSSHATTSLAPLPLSDARNISHSPALDLLLQGSPNKAAIMKDIDEIINSYQGLDKGDHRRDTWAVLNGAQGGHVGSNRDTMALNREALQMLRNLPPTPEEPRGNSEYPAFKPNIFQQSQPQHQYFTPPAPLPQRHGSTESRWSTSSSVYSDVHPPSLYSHDSNASRRSPTPPLSADFSPVSSSASPIQPLNAYQQHNHAPPMKQYVPPQPSRHPPGTIATPSPTRTSPDAPLAASPRTRTPPTAPFAIPPRSRTPIRDDNGGHAPGRTRIHLVPDHAGTAMASSSFSSSPIHHGVYALAGSSSSVMAASAVPPNPQYPAAPNVPHSRSTSSAGFNPSSIRTNTIQGPIATHETMMSGRPCKDNNYWGFCKGAWAIREELKRGLEVQTRPDGMYNTHSIWQCRHCNFQGETFTGPHPTKKGKKGTVVDPKVYVSSVGIHYKWIFLAKSHVKKKTMESGRNSLVKSEEKEDCNYGCVICSVEGTGTGIYGNVETLMNHIFMEHARNMSDKTLTKSKCIIGRTAGANEDWDINIPKTDMLAG